MSFEYALILFKINIKTNWVLNMLKYFINELCKLIEFWICLNNAYNKYANKVSFEYALILFKINMQTKWVLNMLKYYSK